MAISDEIAIQMPLANAQVMIAEHPAAGRRGVQTTQLKVEMTPPMPARKPR
jgi:hypothetical protein